MIKIMLDSSDEPFLFSKGTIIIGDGPQDSVDISFPKEGLHQNHLKITLKENEYLVINQANDPFVTWNGQPFWKKKLKEGDQIQVRNHILHIQQIFHEPALPDEKIPPPLPAVSPLVEEAYNLENHKQERKVIAQERKVIAPPPIQRKKIGKTTVIALFVTLLLFFGIFSEIYFKMADKVDREQVLAAESIADYAMALQYAKVYHIAPQKQNWIDPQFLKNNLVDLLSTTSLPCSNIDAQGQFINCPYILRFYTNRDFSRFLLIAQPDAIFSEWIISRKSLILDSSLMELHKTGDLKALNRLLSYPTPLDGQNGEEIRRHVLQMEVIPLEVLSKETGKSEFAPPRLLGYMKPGAENLIYNAPRYHQFGETFLKKAIALSEEKSNRDEMGHLQSEIDTLAKFHDLVFYSSSGIQEAFKGYQALYRLVIPTNFFTGYLVFSKEGKIINSHLVIDNEPEPLEAPDQDNGLIAYEPGLAESDDLEEIDLAHIFREKVENAQEEIGPILQTIYTSLDEALEKESLYIPPSIIELFTIYQERQKELSFSLKKMVHAFKAAHPQMKDETIELLLREYGLLDFYLNTSTPLDRSHWESLQHLIHFPKIPPLSILV